ncbi:acyl carrier protein [Candidatus Nitrosopelagicus sp.]|jgi:acyl carrier protein|nr:acyl carrier protein [Candidatus Nitrosopelagicus sp.]
MNNKLYLIISRVFNIDISLINNNSSPKTIDTWDSMNMYVLINEVETEFGIKFSLDEILEIQNVQNIENLLVKHGCENK